MHAHVRSFLPARPSHAVDRIRLSQLELTFEKFRWVKRPSCQVEVDLHHLRASQLYVHPGAPSTFVPDSLPFGYRQWVSNPR